MNFCISLSDTLQWNVVKLLLTSAQDVHQLSFASCAVFEQFVHLSRDSRGKWIARPPLAPGVFRTFLAVFTIISISYCFFRRWIRMAGRSPRNVRDIDSEANGDRSAWGKNRGSLKRYQDFLCGQYAVLDGQLQRCGLVQAWSCLVAPVASILRGGSRAPDKMKHLWPL